MSGKSLGVWPLRTNCRVVVRSFPYIVRCRIPQIHHHPLPLTIQSASSSRATPHHHSNRSSTKIPRSGPDVPTAFVSEVSCFDVKRRFTRLCHVSYHVSAVYECVSDGVDVTGSKSQLRARYVAKWMMPCYLI